MITIFTRTVKKTNEGHRIENSENNLMMVMMMMTVTTTTTTMMI